MSGWFLDKTGAQGSVCGSDKDIVLVEVEESRLKEIRKNTCNYTIILNKKCSRTYIHTCRGERMINVIQHNT
jgi:hypothetical protein